MEMRVLRLEMRMSFFLAQHIATRDDSGVAKGAGLLAVGDSAQVEEEAGGAVAAAGGGGGTVGP
jgi:hypothetical protein